MGIKTGKYRHFKGNEYEVLYIAKHSETLEEMVVYRALYGEKGVWVRPASMWDETITRDGNTFKRFEKIDDWIWNKKQSDWKVSGCVLLFLLNKHIILKRNLNNDW